MSKKSKDLPATKTISARIPMASFVEVVEAAKEQKLSVNDYIISKLFATKKSRSFDLPSLKDHKQFISSFVVAYLASSRMSPSLPDAVTDPQVMEALYELISHNLGLMSELMEIDESRMMPYEQDATDLIETAIDAYKN